MSNNIIVLKLDSGKFQLTDKEKLVTPTDFENLRKVGIPFWPWESDDAKKLKKTIESDSAPAGDKFFVMIREYTKFRLQQAIYRISKVKKVGAYDLAFIGIACLIGTLSKFRYGDEKGKDHDFWAKFVKEYFDSKYHPFVCLLYSSYRSALIHSFSTTTDNNKDPRRIELTSGNNQKANHLIERYCWVPIHIDILLKDTSGAYEKYFKELASPTVALDKVKNFKAHFCKFGILGPTPIDVL